MEGIADGVGQALKLFTGRASDQTGKRVAWVAAGYGANAIFRLLTAVRHAAGLAMVDRALPDR